MMRVAFGYGLVLLCVGLMGWRYSVDDIACLVVTDEEASRLEGSADGRYGASSTGCGVVLDQKGDPDTGQKEACAFVESAFWLPIVGVLGRAFDDTCTQCGDACGSFTSLGTGEE